MKLRLILSVADMGIALISIIFQVQMNLLFKRLNFTEGVSY